MARSFLHMLLGVLLWAVFAYYWHLVMKRPITDDTKHALVMVGSIVATITVFDLLWIFHNVRIARRNQRLNRRPDAPSPQRDFLGRWFIAQSEDVIRRARYVEVHVIELTDAEHESAGHKMFRVRDVVPGEEQTK